MGNGNRNRSGNGNWNRNELLIIFGTFYTTVFITVACAKYTTYYVSTTAIYMCSY